MTTNRPSRRRGKDPFALKREEMRQEFLSRMFILGGMITATDTYKRTMWGAAEELGLEQAAYHLTMRKALTETGSDNRLIMAGHEAMLAQWFNRPIKRSDILLARKWCSEKANVKAFPVKLWDEVLKGQPKSGNIRLPVDIYGFAGGQTFLKNVPCMSFEGMGGLISWLEPAMCRYFQPVIQATKARLMREVTPRDAEFGLRAAVNELANIVLLQARYVGSGGVAQLTSADSAEFMWPELFRSIGTIGHELMCALQSLNRRLSDTEYEIMDLALSRVPDSKLLCDLVDALSVGLENAIRALSAHPEATKAGVRIDSGDIAAQCVLYHRKMREAGISPDRMIVYEDEVTPETVKRVYEHFKSETGEEPVNLFPGAGGYWWRGVHRDTVSAAFKRSATGTNPNVKFSNSPGKESIPGYIRVYGRGDVMYVADRSEKVDGEPLFVKLVEQGRIVHHESFQAQAARADATWNRYSRVELSPLLQSYLDRYRAMRDAEVAEAQKRLGS